jgi:DNA-binding CsgD family transcriptional regulator
LPVDKCPANQLSQATLRGVPALSGSLPFRSGRQWSLSHQLFFDSLPDCLPHGEVRLVEGRKTENSIGFGTVTRLHSEGVHVKVMRRGEHPQQLTNSRTAFPRDVFFFYEKNTGVAHFHVGAGPDGRFPVDQAAGLLAMHCMVRGQLTSDYVVMVQAQEELLDGLNEKADKLLEAGKSVRGQVKLTRREEEVLCGLMKSLANKEIAANLNLSERTVKFHVSSLLAKFRVRGRMELVREASRQTAGAMPVPVPTRETRAFAPVEKNYPPPRRAVSMVPLAKRQLMA